MFKEYLEGFINIGSRRQMKHVLNKYFVFLNEDPKTYIVDVRTLSIEEKNKYMDMYERDIKKFNNYLIENYAPKYITGLMGRLKVFFRDHRIPIDDIVWISCYRRGLGNEAIIDDRPPTREELKQILQDADIRAKAYILFLSSSGVRPSEASRLLKEDIDFKTNPVTITINKTKNKHRRYTFISNECLAVLKQWLKVKDQYLEKNYNKMENTRMKIRKKSEDYVFPFSLCSANRIWNLQLEKTGNKELLEKIKVKSNGRNGKEYVEKYRVHLYTLRKYFRTNLGIYNSETGSGADLSEFLMGHRSVIDKAYNKKPIEYHMEQYNKGVRHLMVFEKTYDTKELDEMREELKKKDKQMDEMQANIDNKIEQEIKKHFRALANTPETREAMIKALEEKISVLKKDNGVIETTP